MEFTGHISDTGELKIVNRSLMLQWIADNKGRNVVLTIDKKKKKRSLEQNGFYWKVIVPLMQYAFYMTGNDWDKDETHEALKSKCNLIQIVNEHGEVEDIVKSTRRLTTIEFEEYQDRVRAWAKKFLNVDLPYPDQQATLYTPDTDKNILLVERI